MKNQLLFQGSLIYFQEKSCNMFLIRMKMQLEVPLITFLFFSSRPARDPQRRLKKSKENLLKKIILSDKNSSPTTKYLSNKLLKKNFFQKFCVQKQNFFLLQIKNLKEKQKMGRHLILHLMDYMIVNLLL